MNPHLQLILDKINQEANLTADQKMSLIKAVKDADKNVGMLQFKLERIEKDRNTLKVMLGESIEDLQKKTKAIEEKNHELEIEASLERVRTQVMSMHRSEELIEVCKTLLTELQTLGFKDIRNTQIAIANDDKGSYMSYDYYVNGKWYVGELYYNSHPLIARLAKKMRLNKAEFITVSVTGEELNDWRNYLKSLIQRPAPKLDAATSLNYYYYSIGPGGLGFCAYTPLNDEEMNLLKRFKNVFDLAYRRYADVAKAEAQAREAQIETALERIRARTMAMQKSDELAEAASLLFTQIADLGTNSWSSGFIIFQPDELSINSWMSKPDGSMGVPFNIPVTEDPFFIKIYEAYKRGEEFFVMESGGKELAETYRYMFGLPGAAKALGAIEDIGFQMPTFQITHCTFFPQGFLMFITYEPCSEMWDIFKRFGKVFEQTYTRFLDLQKAEAQAKESQIQLALERVRARTMAMQRSDELKDAAALLFQQAKTLGVPAYSCGYNIWGKNEKVFTSWMSTQDSSDFNAVQHIPLTEDANFIRFAESREKGEQFFVLELRGERMQEHYQYLKTIPAFKAYFDYAISMGFDLPETQIHHLANFSQGNLLFITLEPCPEFHDVFKRFAAVFEQTYTRFLDLQKAEAQAREAKIEAALERVRSRSMGMQKSEELKDVIQVVYEQFVHLNIKIEHTGFVIDYKARDDYNIWIADPLGVPSQVTVPYFDSVYYNRFNEAKEKGEDFFATNLTFEEKNRFYQKLFEYVPGLPEEAKKFYFSCPGLAASTVLLDNVCLYIENFSGIPYTDEENNTLMRFGKVFQQTYTRFLDLQKAEAQAREAKIETALERTRTQSMIMQHSKELDDVLRVFHEQVLLLGINSAFSFLWLPDADKDRHIFWAAWQEEKKGSTVFKSKAIDYPLDRNEPATAQCLVDWKSNEPIVSYHVSPAGVKNYFAAWQELIDGVEQLKPEYFSGGLYYVEAFMKYGCFGVMVATDLMEDEKKLLGRFAIEFERTYTRFLDLQKAEAQAREAQIELGLERVRARAMAMQKSNELSELVDTVFKELTKLDFALTWCIINIIDEPSMSNTVWAANPDINMPPESYHMLFEDYPFHHAMMKGWKERKTKYVYTLEGQEKKIYDEYLFNETEFRKVPEAAQAASRAMEKYVVTFTFSNFGGLQTVGDIPLSDANLDILSRFGKVFDLTYTRFNDLKQAEAQAREAQIEAALERVRSRTMAMQRSEELAAVATVLFQQVKALGVSQWVCGFSIWETGDKEFTWYPGSPDGEILTPCRVSLTEHPVFISFDESKKRGDELFIYEKEGEFQAGHYRYMQSVPGMRELLQNMLDAGQSIPTFQIDHLANFSHGNLVFITYEHVPEMHDVFKRFAKVFDQTYTRFLDLQKAEAQARESQIQLALERVRARTMAMQKSDELSETSFVLFQQFNELGEGGDQIGIGIFEEDEKAMKLYSTFQGSQWNRPARIEFNKHRVYQNVYSAWKDQKKSIVTEVTGKELQDLNKIKLENPDYQVSENELAKDHWVVCTAFFSNGILSYASRESPPKESIELLERFASVFDLTYRRFLDLKQAEAQAREAKIEAALERVRSRTMAMHQTSELQEVIHTVHNELLNLNLSIDGGSFVVINDDVDPELCCWGSGGTANTSEEVQVPHFNMPFCTNLIKGIKRGPGFFTEEFSQIEKKEYFTQLFNHKPWSDLSSEQKKETLSSLEGYTRSVAVSKYTSIFIINHHGRIFTEVENDILRRVAKVFEQTYTRFLDLQKAEAQAREAQIETSLERARSRAMAMQTSEELNELIGTVFTELTKLDFVLTRCVIMIYEGNEKGVRWWMANSEAPSTPMNFFVKYADLPFFNAYLKGWHERSLKWQYILEGEDKIRTDNVLFKETELSLLPDFVIAGMKANDRVYLSASFNNYGCLNLASIETLSDEHFDILLRFAKVFDLTYTRFNDLKQAEAQAREAQIEAALEKVRSRSLAMHKSDELQEVVNTVFERLTDLNIEMDSANIAIFNEGKRDFEFWIASPFQKKTASFHIKGDWDFTIIQELISARENNESVFSKCFSFEEKNDWFKYAFEHTDFGRLPADRQKYILETKAYALSIAFAKNTGVQINNYSGKVPSEGEIEILKRFSKVFEQAYIRFLDLEKAEAQAREAQIEASLERVRAKAMAMHKTEDLNPAVATVFEELDKLDLGVLRCGISVLDKEKRTGDIWVTTITDHGRAVQVSGDESFDIHPLLHGAFEAWLRREDFSYLLKGDDLTQYYKAVQAANFQLPDSQVLSSETEFKQQYCFATTYQAGGLFAFRETEFPPEAKTVMKRFAGVFDLTYKRFLDLQKAEANAREAQIEAGLERVRARTMAMHSSEDVGAATATMFTELERLGIENFRVGITNIHPDRTQDVWSVNNLAEGKIVKAVGAFRMDDHPFWQLMYKEWENKKDFVYTFLSGKEKEDYIKILNANRGYLPQAIQQFPDVHFQVYTFNEGGVWTNSLKPHTEEEKQIMKRFASVFSLTFRRYQDLKKAEAQAKEATIEAALEKVRGKAMAMHNSNDLSVTASMVFTELRKLGINPIRCGVGLINKETTKAQLYSATKSADGDSLALVGWVMLEGHPVLEKIYETWLNNEEYYPQLQGEQLRSYYKSLLSGLAVNAPDATDEQKQYGTFLPFSVGCLYAWSESPYNDAEIRILKRFATIIDLTFRRYIELQKSEANAREAVKQAALDRVRAEIASMRTVSDLEKITPLIWNELTILGVPFIRCGVFLMDDSQKLIHTFLSTPDGKAIAAFHLPYNTPGNFTEVVKHWYNKHRFIDHWGQPEFINMADTLVKQGAISKREQYLNTLPEGGFYLHFLPFLQGMLYVANTTQLGNEELTLIQSVADAFSTAYARYEDFNKLEAAKQQVEKTLTDLKQTQQQLVQSEKMASLGEMTAGIAHEIQNPLNFVNNFSEVSKELLDEMKTELDIGNTADAKDIADDVIRNLEKINHHGKRADAIVKSMLQHSRSSSGKKEPTDINGLADEYLRLAYHGLRAKDKSFNAKFETEFDNSIGKINIISQDIGRVLVNLINNAFYAVSEKKKQEANGYEPTVTVLTKKINDKIEIMVKDNGNGIPQKVLDKIFQPFFTTKPTGQGTGLGLSLSYDIVTKGHGGELKVETKEKEGTVFIVQLPL